MNTTAIIFKKEPFNWFQALQTQEVRRAYLHQKTHTQKIRWSPGYYNLEERYQLSAQVLSELSGDWVTCACGNLCDAIPRRDDNAGWGRSGLKGEPVDFRLAHMGLQFSYQVRTEQYALAISTLREIEERAVEILEQMEGTLE